MTTDFYLGCIGQGMVNPRAPRVFNLYDIIGVFLPGATLLFGILVLFPDPPVPSAIWEYLFYLIVAFSLGHIAQAYSSSAMGELKVFENTMDETRNVLVDDDEDDNDTGEGDEGSGDGEGNNKEESPDDQDDEDTGGEDDDSGLRERFSNSYWGHRILLFILYPLIGPVVWLWWSPNDDEVEELLHANLVWKNLRQTYDLDVGIDRYEDLQQMISSRVDDPRSPVRSYRFQAIRNFHRGMWVSAWFVWLFIVAYEIGAFIPLNGWPYRGLFCFGSVEICSPFIIESYPTVVIFSLLLAVLFVSWRLTVYYERVFIRYLITDYFVAIQNQDTGEVGSGNGG